MIIAIVGPTGVGKTSLSIKLAKKLNASIINCDSMQIYKELNIGTAKIKKEEMENIKHYMIDIKSIEEEYTVYDYQKDARKILDKLLSLGQNVLIVGGTGLYLKALLYDYDFSNNLCENRKKYDFKIVGLTKSRDLLYEAINSRCDYMFDMGLVDEVKDLLNKRNTSRVLNQAIGYKELFSYFDKEISLEEAKEKIKKASRNYAKRQYTFFNNQFGNDIKWYDVVKNCDDEIIEDIMGGLKK